MQLKLVKTYRAVDPRDGWGIAGGRGWCAIMERRMELLTVLAYENLSEDHKCKTMLNTSQEKNK